MVISGKITFDRVPFKSPGQGLNFLGTIETPARLVVVEALGASDIAVASTTTDTAGSYALSVPANTSIRIRAKAQMTKTGTVPTWNFRVLNNTNGDALYAIDGTASDTGTADSVRNLRALSGWGGASYTTARAAAPFAILDTVYKARTLILSADATTPFPTLNLYWSATNKSSDTFCPDTGDILTSVFFVFGANEKDDCATPTTALSGIYILGDFASGNGDTDEFDQHVIAHEFGHYVEENFSRADNIGGDHSAGDRLDPRVAFGEGWGDAFGGMALNDPVYRDSQSGQAGESGFNMDDNDPQANDGWYSESSVFQILWDVFDGGTESGDTVNLGFAPIYSVITGAEKNTDALTTIYSFASALIAANPSSASGIRALLTRESIAGADAFGTGETNFANKGTLSPLYSTVTLNGGAVPVCGTVDFGTYNKLGNRRFLRFDLASSRSVQITAQGPTTGTPAADPDIGLWRRGLIGTSDNTGTTEIYNTPVLSTGTYIIEVADFSHIDQTDGVARRGDTCINVSVTG